VRFSLRRAQPNRVQRSGVKKPRQFVSSVMRAESLKIFKKYFSNPANNYWKQSLLAEYTLGL
jgi:hypothetical protein